MHANRKASLLVVLPLFAMATVIAGDTPQLTGGPYCVSVGIGAERFGHVQTMHTATPDNLDTVRGSIANAYRIVALTYEGKCIAAAAKLGGPGQADRVKECKAAVASLDAKAAAGVRFSGESTSRRIPIVDDGSGGPVVCSCATLYDPSVTGAGYACGGPCGSCWYCR